MSEGDDESGARNVQVKQLDSAVYPAGGMLANARVHACEGERERGRSGRGVSSPIYDDMTFISFIRTISSAAFLSFRNIAVVSSMPRRILTPELRSLCCRS